MFAETKRVSVDDLWTLATPIATTTPEMSSRLDNTTVSFGEILADTPTVVVFDYRQAISVYQTYQQSLEASFAKAAADFALMCADGCGGVGHMTNSLTLGLQGEIFSRNISTQPQKPWEIHSHDHDDHEPCSYCKKKTCHGECRG